MAYLKPVLGRLGPVLACHGSVLACLGLVLACLGSVLGLSWACLGVSSVYLGLSWAFLGLSWPALACLGPVLACGVPVFKHFSTWCCAELLQHVFGALFFLHARVLPGAQNISILPCLSHHVFIHMTPGLLQGTHAGFHLLIFVPPLQRGGTCAAHPPPPEGRAKLDPRRPK